MMGGLVADATHDSGGSQYMDSWGQQINDYVEHLQAGGASASTARLRRHYLRRLSKLQPAGPWITRADLVRYLATPGWSPETRKSVRSTVRGFYSWAAESERCELDPSAGLPSVRVPPGQPRPAPQVIVRQALAIADARDRNMILLALLAGLRRSEIAAAHTRDVLADGMGYSLRVRGKGGRVRTVPLHPDLAGALLALPPGFFFPGQIGGHLSPGYVGKRLTRALGSIGWTGHTLRHRFATNAYAVERDLFAVQQLLGHSKPETTARYTAIPRDSLRTAVNGAGDWAA